MTGMVKKIQLITGFYLLGISSLWVSEDWIGSYFIAAIFFVILASRENADIFQKYMVGPMVLSVSSALVIALISGESHLQFLVIVSLFFFVFALFNPEMIEFYDQDKVVYYTKKCLLPIMFPVSLFFLFLLVMGTKEWLIFGYLGVYFVILIKFGKLYTTLFYSLFIIGSQWFVLFHLLEYVSVLHVAEKAMLYSCIALCVGIRYKKNKAEVL